MAGDLDRLEIPGQRRQGLQEGDGVLGVEHAEDEMQRARLRAVLLALRAEEIGERRAGGFVMAAVEPELAAGRQAPGQRPPGQALQPRRPLHLREAAHLGMAVDAEALEEGQAGEGGAGIGNLMRAGKGGERQLALAQPVGEDEILLLPRDGPFLAIAGKRRLELGGAGLEDGQRLRRLRRHHHGPAALDDAGLLEGDLGERVAEMLHMVEGDRHLYRHHRLRDDIGRIEPPAEAGLQQQDIGGGAGEFEEGGAGRHLEEGDGLIAIRPLALLEERQQRLLFDQLAGKPDALMEAHQMGRGVDMNAISRRLQHGAQIGDDRALAVGAGDMDDGRQAALRMAQALEQPPGAVQGQIDDLGMQLGQPLQDQIAVVGGLSRCEAGHGHRRRRERGG